VNKLNNCKYARELNGKFTIQDIFRDNWYEFLALQKSKGKYIRDSIIKNVDKMIHCRDFDYGFLYYECPNCYYEEITYGWNQINYPICYCPNCGKGTFVPLDIYNKKKH
jgi:ribosomal protein S27E